MKNSKYSAFFLAYLIFVCSNTLFAQQANKFETFSVNGQKGIVRVTDLEEVLAPDKEHNTLEISDKYFLLWQKDSIRPFNKQTGIWEKSLFVSRTLPVIYFNDQPYLHVIRNKKSVLYDANCKPTYELPQQYTSFFSKTANIPNNFLIAEEGNTATVLALKDKHFVRLHQLEASSFSNEELENEAGTSQKVYVLFGGANTYVFNLKFELIKTINSKVMSDLYLDRLLNPNANRMGSPNGPEYTVGKAPDELFREISSDEQYLYYATEDGKTKIRINKGMLLEGRSDGMIWVYKVNRTEKNGATSTSYGAANSYGFLLDSYGGKALIPSKYYKEMNLQVLSK